MQSNSTASLAIVRPPVRTTVDDLSDPALYLDRDLSWLAFNERVLSQAHDVSHPLLERVKFLAISAVNLDEFFMLRVSAAMKASRQSVAPTAADAHLDLAQVRAVRLRAERMMRNHSFTWQTLRTLLEGEHITCLDRNQWCPDVRDFAGDYFARQVFPVLTPLAFDACRRASKASNLSTSFAVVVRHSVRHDVRHDGRTTFARVAIPASLPRFVPVPAPRGATRAQTYLFLEDVIRAHLPRLFPGREIVSASVFRVVRDATLEWDGDADGAEGLLERVDRRLQQLGHGAVSLLQLEAATPAPVRRMLVESLGATCDVATECTDRMAYGDWLQLAQLARPDLRDAPFSPRRVWRADETTGAVFGHLRREDVLVHHPYESFDSFETFLRAAATDPKVVAIKATLYRVGTSPPLVNLLIDAARRGKQVAVLVELKARRDERNNVRWARRLESNGVHVVHGFAGLKTHAKLCLVVRREADGLARYVHVSTGNYNAETARVYTDLGLFTSDPDIVADASELFNHLTGYSDQPSCRRLLVAPTDLRDTLRELVEREAAHAQAGRPAHIIVKVNAITDAAMIRALYSASQAGVRIDLLVRGTCCLRPGVPGVSHNIRVRSTVGRFLEHSRVYWFANGGDEALFIGSADLMERNLHRRIEVLTPIQDPRIRAHVRAVVLDAYLRDSARAMELDAHGHYRRPPAIDRGFDAQAFLLQHYGDERG